MHDAIIISDPLMWFLNAHTLGLLNDVSYQVFSMYYVWQNTQEFILYYATKIFQRSLPFPIFIKISSLINSYILQYILLH